MQFVTNIYEKNTIIAEISSSCQQKKRGHNKQLQPHTFLLIVSDYFSVLSSALFSALSASPSASFSLNSV